MLVPTDSAGRKCGVDNSVINKPHLLFFDLENCIDVQVPLFGCKTPQVCVEKCPTDTFIFPGCGGNPSGAEIRQMRQKLICQMGIDVNQIDSCGQIQRHIDRGECARWYMPSKSCMYSSFFLNYFSFCLSSFYFVSVSSLLFQIDILIFIFHSYEF